MNLPSYVHTVHSFGQLEPATLAGLLPYLVDDPGPVLVAIGIRDGLPADLWRYRLDRVADEAAAQAAVDAWGTEQLDTIDLIARAADPAEAVEALAWFDEPLYELELLDPVVAVAVVDHRWSLAYPNLSDRDLADLPPLDPAWARAAAFALEATQKSATWQRSLRPIHGAAADRAARSAAAEAQLRAERTDTTFTVEADRKRLTGAFERSDRLPSEIDAAGLGICLTDRDIAATAWDLIARAQRAEEGRTDLWCHIARCSTGPARAAAAAFAALAEWRTGGPRAAAFARSAVQADPDSALAIAVAWLTGTGVPASAIDRPAFGIGPASSRRHR